MALPRARYFLTDGERKRWLPICCCWSPSSASRFLLLISLSLSKWMFAFFFLRITSRVLDLLAVESVMGNVVFGTNRVLDLLLIIGAAVDVVVVVVVVVVVDVVVFVVLPEVLGLVVVVGVVRFCVCSSSLFLSLRFWSSSKKCW